MKISMKEKVYDGMRIAIVDETPDVDSWLWETPIQPKLGEAFTVCYGVKNGVGLLHIKGINEDYK